MRHQIDALMWTALNLGSWALIVLAVVAVAR